LLARQEERFMYPIYPLLCFLAALSLDAGAALLDVLWARLRPSAPPSPTSTSSSKLGVGGRLARLVCVLALPLGVSRVLASRRNYGGAVQCSAVRRTTTTSTAILCARLMR
jgi:hypothetical protein